MDDKILTLAKQFIAIRSTADNLPALHEVLELALSHINNFTVERFTKDGVQSALVYNVPSRPSRFKTLLNVHLDVIPGKDNQFIPRVEGDKLYGAGAMDMKGNAAAAIITYGAVAKNLDCPVALQLVTDEEVGGYTGTRYQVEQGVRADFVIATEPTNFDIVCRAKGILQVSVAAKGTSAHGAYPWRGENAIVKMNRFLERLFQRFPVPKEEQWVTTVNLARIETDNSTFNKIPDDCRVMLDIRFIPYDAKTIVQDIKSLLSEGFILDILSHEPSMDTDPSNAYVEFLANATQNVLKKETMKRGANGSSDARHFAMVGCPGVEFGPIGGGIGSDEEWVDINSLETYSKILKEFLVTMINR